MLKSAALRSRRPLCAPKKNIHGRHPAAALRPILVRVYRIRGSASRHSRLRPRCVQQARYITDPAGGLYPQCHFILLALAFHYGLYQFLLYELPNRPDLVGLDHTQLARDTSLKFLAGYVVEYALAIDNVFVLATMFSYFVAPPQFQ